MPAESAGSDPGDYLLIEDTTTTAFPDSAGTRGLGPMGDDYTRVLWSHSTLVVKTDWGQNHKELLGMLGQGVWVRPPHRPPGRRKSNGRGRRVITPGSGATTANHSVG